MARAFSFDITPKVYLVFCDPLRSHIHLIIDRRTPVEIFRAAADLSWSGAQVNTKTGGA